MSPVPVGQHLWIGINGTELDDANRQLLNTVQPGGVVLFARNIESAKQVQMLTRALKTEIASAPLVAIDQEGGGVNRLRAIVGELPSIAEVKRTGAREFGEQVGETLRELGIDVDFAPVTDLELFDATTDNALRGRCWGSTAQEVVRWAGEFIGGLQEQGVAACLKHFPGLGASRQDSHDQLPIIIRDRENLLAEDVRAFAELLPRAGAVMVGHGQYPALDERPASLSGKIVTDLLRRQLEFDGLVVTDDMEMGAITEVCRIGEAAVAALEAGADMLLVCHAPHKILTVHEALTRTAETTQRAESVMRIKRFRQRWVAV